ETLGFNSFESDGVLGFSSFESVATFGFSSLAGCSAGGAAEFSGCAPALSDGGASDRGAGWIGGGAPLPTVSMATAFLSVPPPDRRRSLPVQYLDAWRSF